MQIKYPKHNQLHKSTKKALDAEKYQATALSHPIEVILVTEQERRKNVQRKDDTPSIYDSEIQIRARAAVKKDW